MDTNTLQLADGTETEVQQDSRNAELQNVTPKFKFAKGNYENFDNQSNAITLKITQVRQTILPIFTAALIELLGSDSAIKYDTFNSTFITAKGQLLIQVDITVIVNKWIGTDVSKEAANKDAQYVLNRLKVVPNVNWQNCMINTNDGSLNLRFTI